jgi:hypothetical protein
MEFLYPGNLINPPSIAALAVGLTRLTADSVRRQFMDSKEALTMVGTHILQTSLCVYGSSWFWYREFKLTAWTIALIPIVLIIFVAIMFGRRTVIQKFKK